MKFLEKLRIRKHIAQRVKEAAEQRREIAKVDVLLSGRNRWHEPYLTPDQMLSIVRNLRPEKPTILLFPENALLGGGLLTYSDAGWLAQKVKMGAPSGLHVLFSAPCLGPAGTVVKPQTRIYHINGTSEWRPKYSFTMWDAENIGIETDEGKIREMGRVWKNQHRKFHPQNYIRFEVEGISFQARVCLDVARQGLGADVTLVSASNLPIKKVTNRASDGKTKAIVVNDGGTGHGNYQTGAYFPSLGGNYDEFYRIGAGYALPHAKVLQTGINVSQI